MPIVGGLDIHRKQITFNYLDTVTGEVRIARSDAAQTAAPAIRLPPITADCARARAIAGSRCVAIDVIWAAGPAGRVGPGRKSGLIACRNEC